MDPEYTTQTVNAFRSLIYTTSVEGRTQKLFNLISSIRQDQVDYVLNEYEKVTGNKLFKDIDKMYAQAPKNREVLREALSKAEYSKYGLGMNYKREYEMIQNKYYSGDLYSMYQKGTKMVILDNSTKEKRELDLEVLLQNYPNTEQRAQLMLTIQKMPVEALMDLARETEGHPFVPRDPDAPYAAKYVSR